MSKAIDLTGKRFGRLLVTGRGETKFGTGAFWKCRCDCGNTVTVWSNNLRSGNTTSCGCLKKEHPNATKHGFSGTKLYGIWHSMRSRCENKNDAAYQNYGGRGISVFGKWKDPQEFISWAIASGYRDGLTLDRIDTDGDYCPENCRWATWDEQQNNRRNNTVFAFNGETKTLAQWCKSFGVEYSTAYKRIFILGWSFHKAMTEPVNENKRNRKAGVRIKNG